MTDKTREAALAAFNLFNAELQKRGAIPIMHDLDTPFASEKEVLDHCAQMLIEMRVFIVDGKFDKFMRWVCWIQGALNGRGILTVDDFRKMNISLLHADNQ